MLGKILRLFVEYIAYFHDLLGDLFIRRFGITDDKLMHLLVIGIIGFVMLAVIQPIVSYLVKRHRTVTITFFYVFTVIIVLVFAIEIGQRVTDTGGMEFADIAYGIIGFLLAFLVYLILYGIVRLIKKKAS
ncbi:MAG: hypothetical protein IIZ47_06775 [Erysipelotrichaceae bacterium]|nr:hypothetical protein [Erysipelotrichaceae bacterium]